MRQCQQCVADFSDQSMRLHLCRALDFSMALDYARHALDMLNELTDLLSQLCFKLPFVLGHAVSMPRTKGSLKNRWDRRLISSLGVSRMSTPKR